MVLLGSCSLKGGDSGKKDSVRPRFWLPTALPPSRRVSSRPWKDGYPDCEQADVTDTLLSSLKGGETGAWKMFADRCSSADPWKLPVSKVSEVSELQLPLSVTI